MAQWERINLSMQDTQVPTLGWEDPLEKEMATHSSILAWEIPWTEELSGYKDHKNVGHNLATKSTTNNMNRDITNDHKQMVKKHM